MWCKSYYLWIFGVFIVLFATAWSINSYQNVTKQKTYEGYRTYEIRPTADLHFQILALLRNASGFDFWSNGISKTDATVLMVSPKRLKVFKDILKFLPHRIVLKDVGKTLAKGETVQRMTEPMKPSNVEYLNHYLRYDEITEFLNDIRAEHPNNAEVEVIGKTFETRDIHMIKLSSDFEANKKVVFIEAGMHAREWIAPALAMHAIQTILEKQDFLTQNDWYIVPISNPDGYEFSHTDDRLWRKTRSPTSKWKCFGADGNRNFDTHWGEFSSDDPCDQTYHGTGPFSESEAEAIWSASSKIQDRIQAFISLHSFGGKIMYPYASTKILPNNWIDLESCGIEARDAVLAKGGPHFEVGNTARIMYLASGGSDDFMKEKLEVPFSYTVELPGSYPSGFEVPITELFHLLNTTFHILPTIAECSLRNHSNSNSENKEILEK